MMEHEWKQHVPLKTSTSLHGNTSRNAANFILNMLQISKLHFFYLWAFTKNSRSINFNQTPKCDISFSRRL